MVDKVVPGKKGFQAIPLAERFWSQVKKTDTCWLWQGSTAGDGYGRIWVDGHRRLTHVVSLALVGRVAPIGLETDHLCRTPACVRPEHLEFVTHAENLLRGDNYTNNVQRLKTHCRNGHPYRGANLLIVKGGKRRCRACARQGSKKYRAKLARAAIEEARK